MKELKKNMPLKFVLIRLDPITHEKLKVYSVRVGESIQKMMTDCIKDILNGNYVDKKF